MHKRLHMVSYMLTLNDLKIFKALISEEINVSEISRKTNISKNRVLDSLKRLNELDLVRKTISGRSHIYRINFLNSKSLFFINLISSEKKDKYNIKLNNLPIILDAFLKNVLKEKYSGSIFFGSSIENEKFNDVDVFIIAEEIKQKNELIKKIKLIDSRLSPIFGSKEEIEKGIEKKDMLYQNIAEGISYSYEDFIRKILYKDASLKKKDIQERVILGYREILSCLEFKEKEYVEKHLDKGLMDVIYAILNYFDISPKNDAEAKDFFKERFKTLPKTVKESLSLVNKFGAIL